jgi:hypothetical protein
MANPIAGEPVLAGGTPTGVAPGVHGTVVIEDQASIPGWAANDLQSFRRWTRQTDPLGHPLFVVLSRP